MSWTNRVMNVIAEYDISLAEFIVLDEVRMRVPLRAHSLARFCVKEVDHLNEVKFAAADYANAIDSCIERGLLRVLAIEDLENLSDIGTTVAFPELSYRAYEEGSVDFMPLGYEVMQKLMGALRR
jgi:hypothetical protein